ncbi:MAG: hypothetical protein COA49_06125 [Bacteroidetes bacterium]|nr:MAG: hypothetical protein COA49_06125 [Bacteroidota bacterium]
MQDNTWSLRTFEAREYPGLSPLVLGHLDNLDSSKSEMKTDNNYAKWESNIKPTLCEVIIEEYQELGLPIPFGLKKLQAEGSRTITTGHQLQIAGGPAFLHYKTITTIRQARENGAVPVFWLASEDHDFKEVSWVNGEAEKFVWSSPLDKDRLPVGRLSLEGVREVLEAWMKDVKGEEMMSALSISIENNESYAQLFRRWMHLWYGDTDLIVLDADNPKLKVIATSLFAEEFTESGVSKAVLKRSEELVDSGYNAAAHVRDVNLFYMPRGEGRIGIVKEVGGEFKAGERVLNEGGEDWEVWCERNAENLSPGVLLRPLYQELLLPNLKVVLGPGELSYWKQLSIAFSEKGLKMPTLHLRDHVLVMDSHLQSVANEVGWSLKSGWWNEDEWVNSWVDSNLPSPPNDFDKISTTLEELKYQMTSSASSIDPTLKSAALASSAGMEKVWSGLRKKIRKAIKRLNQDEINKISKAASRVSSNRVPQDRYANFHVLSKSLGGFKVLRNLLLNSKTSQIKQGVSVMHIVEENS